MLRYLTENGGANFHIEAGPSVQITEDVRTWLQQVKAKVLEGLRDELARYAKDA